MSAPYLEPGGNFPVAFYLVVHEVFSFLFIDHTDCCLTESRKCDSLSLHRLVARVRSSCIDRSWTSLIIVVYRGGLLAQLVKLGVQASSEFLRIGT